MKTILLTLMFAAMGLTLAAQDVTLDECIKKAHDNYPLIKKYELIERTAAIDLSDISKSWLPQIGVYAQSTVQNKVPNFPDDMRSMLSASGIDLKGMREDQYKVGVDVNQTVWDGGKTKADRDVAQSDAQVKKAATDVNLYAVRERVQDLYFAVLLTEAQVEQTRLTAKLLQNNLDKLRSMLAHGTATQSDADVVEAEYLTVSQNILRLQNNARSYRHMLEIFTGMSLEDKTLECPPAEMPSNLQPDRPELSHFEAELAKIESLRRQINVSTLPKIGLFAQAYYGYPGYDYFKSMTSRDWTINVMAGIKITYSIDAFYTKKNKQNKLSLAGNDIEVSKDVFLFNNRLTSIQQQSEISRQQAVLAEDARIVELRTSVRKAAESRLANGVIDTTDLLGKITDELTASIRAAYHQIELVKTIYQLKYTLNR